MKVVAYSIKAVEKEFLAIANHKKHDITLISNPLTMETAVYAEGKDAVVVFINDDVSASIINKLADMGIKYITTRSAGVDHIDTVTAAKRGIKIANVPDNRVDIENRAFFNSDEMQQAADITISNLDNWQQDKCAGKACVSAQNCHVTKN